MAASRTLVADCGLQKRGRLPNSRMWPLTPLAKAFRGTNQNTLPLGCDILAVSWPNQLKQHDSELVDIEVVAPAVCERTRGKRSSRRG